MNLGLPEMMFIFLLALLLFGPKKLPEIGRQIGKALAEFKRASNEFKSQLETEIRQIEVEEALRKEKDALTQAILPPAGTISSKPAPPVFDASPAGLGADRSASLAEPSRARASEGPDV
jgi:sec-independent protein translocase protein TatB